MAILRHPLDDGGMDWLRFLQAQSIKSSDLKA